MGVVEDRFLKGMNEQKQELLRQNKDLKSISLLRFKSPMSSLGFQYEETSMFDVDYAKGYG